ncbi:MAG: serine/threonine protein kinase, partial [Rubripirellula sp.]
MDQQEIDGNSWPTWLGALSVSSATLVVEAMVSTLNPLVVPHLCAAFIGSRLPTKQFLFLMGLLACCIMLPMLAYSADPNQLSHRLIGVLGLLLVAALRLLRPEPNETPSYDWDQSLVSEFGTLSASSTEVRATKHHAQGLLGDDVSFEMIDDQDHLQPMLEQLEAEGDFNSNQMQLIENALRKLDGQSVNFEFAASLEQGQRIGSFVVDEALGRGGEGHVYRGRDASGKAGAIKILHNMRVSDRFRREMHMVRQLAHPNIVTAYEVGEFRGLPFITMELLSGPDLHVLVRDSGPLDWQVSAQYVLQAVRALAHAHRRDLVHRDIKPGNLILHGDSTVKLVDLGLAAMSTSAEGMDSVFHFETQDGHLAGTLPFMAPEQARSLANATIQADIYGLGATWFYMLTGRERLRGESFSDQIANLLVRRRFNALRPGTLPEQLERIYQRMVAYNPNDRYDSCELLAEDLESALIDAGETVAMVDGINVLVVEDSRTDMLFTIEMLR